MECDVIFGFNEFIEGLGACGLGSVPLLLMIDETTTI